MELSENNVSLINQTRPYANEFIFVSVWVVLSTFGFLFVSVVVSFLADAIFVKAILSVLIGLLIVRCFILFHDYHHKAILSRSSWAKYLFDVFGLLIFTPGDVWRQSHNFHHAHNTILETSHIGSFWTVSVEQWLKMSKVERYKYCIVRSPLTILFGFFTVFIYDHCIHNFLRSPLKNISALFALMLQGVIIAVVIYYDLFFSYLFAWVLPIAIAGCLGSYLFYAQHNFPGMQLLNRQNWAYSEAALVASSFIKMPAVMHWFTGNIAYHHVHHLNHRIPFYRLPETMAAIDGLHSPVEISLRWGDVVSCLRLKLWDEKRKKMIGFDELNDSTGLIKKIVKKFT